MFVTVKTTAKHSGGGAKHEVGDQYTLRRQQAKILQALGKVSIVEDSESPSPSVAAKARVEAKPAQVAKPAAPVTAAPAPVTKDLTAATTADDKQETAETPATTESDKKDDVAPVSTETVKPAEKPKADDKPVATGRKSKYGTKVMTAGK